MLEQAEINDRTAVVRERIAAAARRSGRQPDDITLVAVTKTWPAELVLRAHAAGLYQVGENRPEELAQKRPQVEAALGTSEPLTWHLIGTLQSRKTDLAAAHADLFHALDRVKIANRLSRDLVANGRQVPVFVEVNVSGEASKSGFNCTNWENDATQRELLRTGLIEVGQLPGLTPVGLMTMAPWDVSPDEVRQVFYRTRLLRDWLQNEIPGMVGNWLSMGMTDDFELAIEEGATHVRVGRALFGERTPH
ncbi:MAG: YggS family pyridoxal phosphate-dependent enzyme [Chloroflexota bacterium]